MLELDLNCQKPCGNHRPMSVGDTQEHQCWKGLEMKRTNNDELCDPGQNQEIEPASVSPSVRWE